MERLNRYAIEPLTLLKDWHKIVNQSFNLSIMSDSE
jgi:hypothetical protein